MIDLKSLSKEEIAAFLKELGEPAFRAKQVFSWLHSGARSFEEMSNLSKDLRARLAQRAYISVPKPLRKQVSREDGTIKYLWELADGNCIETVLMKYRHGNSVCISSQVGCRMGCTFCASALGGRVRDLSAGEMLDQVLFTQIDSGEPISNIVLMGIGEPLDNYYNVRKFLQLVNHPEGMHIGMRHISLSTCGLVPGIRRLAEEGLQLTLSVSLHAADDEARSAIMPVNRRYPLSELMEACRDYFQKTARRISYEYAMIEGINDSPEQAERLCRLLRCAPGHVNLIPLNLVEESGLRASTSVRRFQKRLEERGIPVTVRRRLGSDIDASCGQLRRRAQKEEQASIPLGESSPAKPERKEQRR